ncbi:MAG: hypothetical protein IJI66_14495 [Erysipelotrichaceae bacterium]|nr:hypothetical protein [Erysipelotrichaceae bacterium]
MIYPYYRLCDTDEEEGHCWYFYDFTDHTVFRTQDERADLHKEAVNEERNTTVRNVILAAAVCFVLALVFITAWAYLGGINYYYPDYSSFRFWQWLVEQLIVIAVSVLIWFYIESEKRKKVMMEIKDEAVKLDPDRDELRRLYEQGKGSEYLKRDLLGVTLSCLYYAFVAYQCRWWILLIYTLPVVLCAFLKVNMDSLPSASGRILKLTGPGNASGSGEQEKQKPERHPIGKGGISYVLAQLNTVLSLILGAYPRMIWLIPVISIAGIILGHLGRREEDEYVTSFIGLVLNRILLTNFILAIII